MLDIGQVQGAEGVGHGHLALIHKLQVKIRLPLRRNERKVIEHSVVGEGFVEPVEDDEVGRNEEKVRSVAAAVLYNLLNINSTR